MITSAKSSLHNLFIRNVFMLIGSTATGQAIGILAYPVLTRIYTPKDFGILGIYSSVASLVTVIAAMKYEIAVTLPRDDDDAVSVVLLGLSTVVLITVLTTIFVLFFGLWATTKSSSPIVGKYLWLLPINVFGMGIYQVFNYWCIRRLDFKSIARTKVTQMIGQSLSQVIFGLLQSNSFSLIAGQVTGQSLGCVTLGKSFWLAFRSRTYHVNLKSIRKMMIRYRKFPLISSVSGLINAGGLQVPSLLFAWCYDPNTVGWFMFGQRVIATPIGLIGTAVAQVFLATAANMSRDNPDELFRMYKLTAKKLLLVGMVPTGLLIAFGPWLFSLLFGGHWYGAGKFAQLLGISFLTQFIVVPLSQTLNVVERQDLQFVWDVLRLIMVCATLIIAHKLSMSSLHTVALYSIVTSIMYLVLFWITYVTLSRDRNRWSLFKTEIGREPAD